MKIIFWILLVAPGAVLAAGICKITPHVGGYESRIRTYVDHVIQVNVPNYRTCVETAISGAGRYHYALDQEYSYGGQYERFECSTSSNPDAELKNWSLKICPFQKRVIYDNSGTFIAREYSFSHFAWNDTHSGYVNAYSKSSDWDESRDLKPPFWKRPFVGQPFKVRNSSGGVMERFNDAN